MNFPLGISCSKEMVVDQTRQGKLSLTLTGIEPIVTHNVLPFGLIADQQSNDNKIWRLWVQFPTRSRGFPLHCEVSNFLTWADAQWKIHGFP